MIKRKRSIPNNSRRLLAIKCGCKKGESLSANCYFCNSEGEINWHKTSKGNISLWVTFSNLEIDHFIPESKGGSENIDNLILSCRACNRRRKDKDAFDFLKSIRG